MATVSLYMLISCINGKSYDLVSWTKSGEIFSETDQDSIVAFDDITRNIWILGGYWNREKIYTYNIDTDALTDMTTAYNPTGTTQFSYNYHHSTNALIIDRTIYYSNSLHFDSLNIDTYQYTQDFTDFIDTYMCMVTDTDKNKLYFAAGRNYKRFRIYDLLTKQVQVGPDLTQNHWGGACYVYNNIFYVMAGKYSQIIEFIDLNVVNDNIMYAKWNTLEAQLPTYLYSLSSAMCGHLIFIIGGRDEKVTANGWTKSIYILDTHTNKLSNGSSLAYASTIAHAPAICVESRVYIFKGYSDGIRRDTVWFADLYVFTDEPTVNPTHPTKHPTLDPTKTPTHHPSNHPTDNPTSITQDTDFLTNTIIIENHENIEKGHVAFRLLNVDTSCGGSLLDVAITDHSNYKDKWVHFDRSEYYRSGECHFEHQGSEFTVPITVRITKHDTIKNDSIIGYDVIVSFSSSIKFDFGGNFCYDAEVFTPSTETPIITAEVSIVESSLDFEGFITNNGIIIISSAVVLCCICVCWVALFVWCCLGCMDSKKRNTYNEGKPDEVEIQSKASSQPVPTPLPDNDNMLINLPDLPAAKSMNVEGDPELKMFWNDDSEASDAMYEKVEQTDNTDQTSKQ